MKAAHLSNVPQGSGSCSLHLQCAVHVQAAVILACKLQAIHHVQACTDFLSRRVTAALLRRAGKMQVSGVNQNQSFYSGRNTRETADILQH